MQKKAAHCGPPFLFAFRSLEIERTFDLDQSWRSVAAEEGSKDTGGWVDGGLSQAKSATGNVRVRRAEIGMVQEVEELETHLEAAGLHFWNLKGL